MQKSQAGVQGVSSRYQILDNIGHGGMGIVYRAYDRLTGNTVALKKVNTSFEKTPSEPSEEGNDFRLSLAQEFKMLASLRHPNIISVLYYVFDEQQQPYLPMEFLDDAVDILSDSD